MKELTKEKERLNRENERLDKENDKLDRWIEKRERINKWLDEVSEALKQGAPVPDQPEDPEIIYPGYREDNDTSEDVPGAAENAPAPSAEGAPAPGSPENLTSGPHPQEGGPQTIKWRAQRKIRIGSLWTKQCLSFVVIRKLRGPQSPLKPMLLWSTGPQLPQTAPPLTRTL